MLKQDGPTKALAVLTDLLSPACQRHGLTLRNMPDSSDIGVVRTTSVIPFVSGVDTTSNTGSADWHERQTGRLSVKCYVLVLSASQLGPRSAEAAVAVVIGALDGTRTDLGCTVFVNGSSFTSYKDGIWQYRVSVDLEFPYSGQNLSAKQDLTNKIVTW